MLVEQEELIRAARELEPLPTTVTRLAQILARTDFDLRDVEEAVSLDQALTPRILRLANSALASRGHPIATVRDAVMRVGTGPIFSIAMALGVKARFKRAIAQYDIAEGELWVHSVAAALTVESLGASARGQVPVESFTAALLHDVGKLVMARFLEPNVLQLLRTAETTNGISSREAEVELLGVDHGELGAIVAQHWNLPERLVRGIQCHHAPGQSPDAIAHVVHVADVVSHLVGAKRDKREPPPSKVALDPATTALLKLDANAVEGLAGAVGARLEDVLKRYT